MNRAQAQRDTPPAGGQSVLTAADPAGISAGETEESVSTRSLSRSPSSPCSSTALETLDFPLFQVSLQ